MEGRGGAASRLRETLAGFRALFSFYLSILSLCSVFFALDLVYPWLNGSLVASRSTPWGVVTSLFVHRDLSHMAMNLVGLLSFVLVFSFTNYYLSSVEVVSRVRFFIVAVLAATMLSNVFWIVIANIGSIGASGLVYASEGVVTGFCLLNFWDTYSARGSSKSGRGVMLINLLVFLGVCGWIVFYTNSFLSYGRDVNVLIHGSSFVIAFILAIEWGNIRNIFKR